MPETINRRLLRGIDIVTCSDRSIHGEDHDGEHPYWYCSDPVFIRRSLVVCQDFDRMGHGSTPHVFSLNYCDIPYAATPENIDASVRREAEVARRREARMAQEEARRVLGSRYTELNTASIHRLFPGSTGISHSVFAVGSRWHIIDPRRSEDIELLGLPDSAFLLEHWRALTTLSPSMAGGVFEVTEVGRMGLYGFVETEGGSLTYTVHAAFLSRPAGRNYRSRIPGHLRVRVPAQAAEEVEEDHDNDRDYCDCSDCINARNEDDYGSDLIRDYSYKPTPIFHGKGPVFLGTELEVQTGRSNRSDMARLVQDTLGSMAYMKTDSSIEGDGFEIVTHPMSYDFMLEKFPTSLLQELSGRGARPHVSCGMHVHVSRDGFTSASHQFKWMKFIYKNQSAIEAIARRQAGHWASFAGPQERHSMDMKHFAKGAYGGERYQAINASNANTFEVRVFRSTLSPRKFMAGIGLVDASVAYSAEINAEKIVRHKAWHFPAFKEWLRGRDKYDALNREIARLEI